MQTACCRAQLRASEDLPLIVLASVPDKEFALVLCRDAQPQRDGRLLASHPRRRLLSSLRHLDLSLNSVGVLGRQDLGMDACPNKNGAVVFC